MPELRKDPVVGRWVIVSTERPPRLRTVPPVMPPAELEAHLAREQALCPFCPGREEHTPHEVLAYRSHGQPANGPGWSVRVVPNKFPVLRVEGGLQREGDGIYDRMSGLGAHEVVIESTRHRLRLGEMQVGEIEQVAWAWRDRIIDLRRDFRLKYVLVFKNDGVAAGAHLAHPHSQLIALPIVPCQVSQELAGAKAYFGYRERCLFCDMVRQELKDGQRLIYENTGFVVFAPFAQRFPFETWVLPRDHFASYQDCPRQVYRMLAEALKVALFKLDRALDCPAYSMILHNAPFAEDRAEHYHWHIEIMPALAGVSGFEWGSGFYINPTPPEESARFLRDEIPLGL